MSLSKKGTFRIIDANFNRAKEGLRVCEDISRFIMDAGDLTKIYKGIRHQLTDCIRSLELKELVHARDIERDVGKTSTPAEARREKIEDIFYANSQRVKESIRVLEEFSKLFQKKTAQKLKEIRYKVYGLERKMVERF